MYVCVHTYKAPANVYIVYLVINCACIDNFHTGGGGVQSWIDHPLLSYSAILQQYSEFCLANTLGCSCSFRTRQVNRSDCSLALRENFEDLFSFRYEHMMDIGGAARNRDDLLLH